MEQVVNDFQFRNYPIDKFPGPKQLLELMAIELQDQYGWNAEIIKDKINTIRIGNRHIYNLRAYKNGYNIAYITVLNAPCGFANSKEKYKFIREKMFINSELPLTMLQENFRLNEYDFVLFHLYKQYPAYREYYKRMRQEHPERLMILDNSAYEFFVKGETLNQEEFANAIIDLRPDLYILPDVLMNKQATLEDTFSFLAVHEINIWKAFTNTGLKTPQPMAVAQGDSADELFDCLLKYRQENIRNVALPFHNSFYKKYDTEYIITNLFKFKFGELTDDHHYAIGRVKFAQDAKLLLKRFEHVHLLGSHCPYEKCLHGKYIHTIDTGYPVKCAIEGYEMFTEPAKPNIIIDEFMETELTDRQKQLIDTNINAFKTIRLC